MTTTTTVSVVVIMMLASTAATVLAPHFPARTIRLIAPAQMNALGQQVVVESRGGAAGAIVGERLFAAPHEPLPAAG